jgi:hypothetical protein
MTDFSWQLATGSRKKEIRGQTTEDRGQKVKTKALLVSIAGYWLLVLSLSKD